MARCTICEYFFQPDAEAGTSEHISCPVCRVRTTPAHRAALLSGRRLDFSYMDSD